MELDERFADRVADLCYKKYQSLPKKGKPQKNKEWTLLSCVCLTRNAEEIRVVSLGTGTKCIGKSKLSADERRILQETWSTTATQKLLQGELF